MKVIIPIFCLLIYIFLCNIAVFTHQDNQIVIFNKNCNLIPGSDKTEHTTENNENLFEKDKGASDVDNKRTEQWITPFYDLQVGIGAGYPVLFDDYSKYIKQSLLYSVSLVFNPRIFDRFLIQFNFTGFPTKIKHDTQSDLLFFMYDFGLKYEIPLSESIGLFGAMSGGIVDISLKSIKFKLEDKDKRYLNSFVSGKFGIGLTYLYNYTFSVTLDYKHIFEEEVSIPFLSINTGISYRFGGNPENTFNDFIYVKPNIENIFPAQSTFYAVNGPGTLEVQNRLKSRIKKSTRLFLH